MCNGHHVTVRYPLAVKLGTITPNGADVYSYSPDEDNMVKVTMGEYTDLINAVVKPSLNLSNSHCYLMILATAIVMLCV